MQSLRHLVILPRNVRFAWFVHGSPQDAKLTSSRHLASSECFPKDAKLTSTNQLACAVACGFCQAPSPPSICVDTPRWQSCCPSAKRHVEGRMVWSAKEKNTAVTVSAVAVAVHSCFWPAVCAPSGREIDRSIYSTSNNSCRSITLRLLSLTR